MKTLLNCLRSIACLLLLHWTALAQQVVPGTPTQAQLQTTLNPVQAINPPNSVTFFTLSQDVTWAPSASTVAAFAHLGRVTVTGSGGISGAGHAGGEIGWLINQNTGTLPLLIGLEAKIENDNGGTVTTMFGNDSNLSGTNGPITNYFAYPVQASNITALIGAFYGFYFPAINGVGGNTVNPTSVFAYANLEPAALTYTVGPIITTSTESAATNTSTGLTSANTLQLDTGTKTATATAGAATLNKSSGKITSEALTTAGLASYTLTLTDSQIAAADTVFASLAYGTNTTGTPIIQRITPAAGSVVIIVFNAAAATALNGTIVISFHVFKA